MIVVVAEKPSVARELADLLGAAARRSGFFEGNGYQVTWAVGHLVGLAEPADITPEWKLWRREALPMLPSEWPLVVLESGRAQFQVVERLLRAPETTSLIAATDAGREGELIFRYIYEKAGCSKPWQRLWLASLTPDAIRQAFACMEPGEKYDGLAAAARARSQADWLVGMNLTRAYSITSGKLYSVGRVQTPTLAMVVLRDREIESFSPQPYLEVEATFEGDTGQYRGTYYVLPSDGLRDERGRLRAFQAQQARLPADGRLAATIAQRARIGRARVLILEQTQRRAPAPQLFDLTTLQKECNRLFGLSAQQTLDAAQELYETHKALSYPRTDCRYLSVSVANTLPAIVNAVAPNYPGLVAAGSGTMPGTRWVNDPKIGDHHALIPTTQVPRLTPGSPAALVYDLVCRRTLMMWHPESVDAVTRLLTEVRSDATVDLFATQGASVEVAGWTVLEIPTAGASERDRAPRIPGGIQQEAEQRVVNVAVHKKATRAPQSHTEASLLAFMESAGRHVDDEAIREAMRDTGLGTPATRAATIETLIEREYIERRGKTLKSTLLGRTVILSVSRQVASPEMTGQWEQRLHRIERGEEQMAAFMDDIGAYVQEAVRLEASKPAAPRAPRGAGASRSRTSRSVSGQAQRSQPSRSKP